MTDGICEFAARAQGEGERIWAPRTSRRGNKQTHGPELAAHNHPACWYNGNETSELFKQEVVSPGCSLLVRAEPTVGALAENACLWRASRDER
jgi:hypothetical protein